MMITHELARARHAELRAEASRIRLARRAAKSAAAAKRK
jgi:hypothetical protein